MGKFCGGVEGGVVVVVGGEEVEGGAWAELERAEGEIENVARGGFGEASM